MSVTQQSTSTSTAPVSVSGDIVGGALLALLGLVHLFVLQIGDLAGALLLLCLWPLAAGAVAIYVDRTWWSVQATELPLTGAVAGIFGAVTTAMLVLLTGLLGVWSAFIFDVFGVELAPVTLGVAILLALFWTVFGYLGGYVASRALT